MKRTSMKTTTRRRRVTIALYIKEREREII
jgi:hypothetical protein